MTKFTTKIQLLNASEKDYTNLHRELEKQSFKEKKITGKVITIEKQYKREGNISIQDVTSSILKAAYKTGKEFTFTIIKNKPVYG